MPDSKPPRGRPPNDGEPATGHIHIRTTLHRKSAYVRAARPRPLAEWLTQVADCADYHTFRTSQIHRTGADRGPGHRSVDLELTTLSNILNWAVETRRIDRNPIARGRRRFTRGDTVVHCRDHMPSSASELHTLARHLFQSHRGTVLGAQLLLEAFTGCRTSEILKLRWDATRTGTTAQPGYIDTQHLWIHRSKHGIHPFVNLHPALNEFLATWRTWCQIHYPDSPWILPGYGSGGQLPPTPCALTKNLNTITVRHKIPHRTSHGLRAYYVTVRRAQSIPDAQIAVELGQSSGAALIVQVYGAVPPNWIGGPELTWLPPEPEQPAWHLLREALPANIITAA